MIYEIKNLYCKYINTDSLVLRVESLDVHKGDVMFVLGSSGVGKSTLLETLGLMNNTIEKVDQFDFNINGTKLESVDRLWQESEKEMAEFRNEHLSFIFQSTNLFSHLSAYENAILPSLIQGKDSKIVRTRANSLFKRILRDERSNKNITEYSGGQRQRIAFIRALVGDYNVLFADEPTGNLDSYNADKLMKEIVENVKVEGKTVVVVSHDMKLAMKYSNALVYIDKESEGEKDKAGNTIFHGAIKDSTIYRKNSKGFWSNGLGVELTDEELKTMFTNKLEGNYED
jgi:ABC-type lipoprotein export system ATPase subunit